MLTKRLTNAATALMCSTPSQRPSSKELMDKIPANNPPDYFKMLRHDYGITVLKEKVKGKRHYLFWIPKEEHPKVLKLIAAAPTTAIEKSDSKSNTTNSDSSLSQFDSKGDEQ